MGQYYLPIALDKRGAIKAWWYSHNYDNGLKLMEHSYIGNMLCNAVERFLIDNPTRLVWAGDYADNEKGKKFNLFDLCDRKPGRERKNDDASDLPSGMFVVNHTKKEYYARDEVKGFMVSDYRTGERWEMKINPLPLMTSEGNGQGGGDYYGEKGVKDIERWARDVIELTATEPEGYKKINPYFKGD